MKIILLLISAVLFGCAVAPDKVLRIRSLEEPIAPSSNTKNGKIIGLKELTANAKNTNIVVIHGMGWTQELSDKKFGDDLVNAILMAYKGSQKISNDECPSSDLDKGTVVAKNIPQGLMLYGPLSIPELSTDDPKLKLKPFRLGCIEQVLIKLNEEKTITVYKFFWDDAMWNSIEFQQIGYDDPLTKNSTFSGYDIELDKERAKFNRKLKNEIVTYGFADAAMYMGPAGKALREGVQAAICVALSNSYDSFKSTIQLRVNDACANQPSSKAPLILMSHSLGSRIVFDTIKTDLTEVLSKQIETGVSNDTVELHMFANQIPLIGLGRMGAERSPYDLQGKNLKLVAYSETNDLLTFELVPYFEQMCYSRKVDKQKCSINYSSENNPNRDNLSRVLGFDVVDVRLKFAPNLFKIIPGFKDPGIAHTGYLKNPSALNILFCGTTNGVLNSVNGKCKK